MGTQQRGDHSRPASSSGTDEAGLQQIDIDQVSVVAALPTQGVGYVPALPGPEIIMMQIYSAPELSRYSTPLGASKSKLFTL